MEQYIVKAKRIDNGEWVNGYLWNGNDHAYIIPYNVGIGYDTDTSRLSAVAYEVDKETICRFSGLTDKNGNKIWENDIVYIPYAHLEDTYCKVIFTFGAFIGELADGTHDSILSRNAEVIGNIFDNSELLEVVS